jgi:drug/metabolite transporter (DMT)-like permease
MRLSLLIPVLLSVFLYKEYLNLLEILGVLIVFSALVLLIPRRNKDKLDNVGAGWLLIIIFALSGFADASLKVYQEEFSRELNELLFMGLIFGGAFLIGIIICTLRKGPIFRSEEVKLGALIGIPNLYSSIFLIYALGEISGAIAYPMVNMLNVAGGTALGIVVWGDIISLKQWVGLGLALAAILLLL